MTKFIAIQGTPADGFEYFGPFDTPNDAAEYVEADYSRENWWIVPLTAPTSPDEIQCGHCGHISNLTGLIGPTTDNCPKCGNPVIHPIVKL